MRDIVVVGTSAGGVEALQAMVKGLPPNLPASIFAVLHLPPGANSELPAILSKAGPLPAHEARMDEKFERGHIYVAPADRHLLLDQGRIQLWRGPRENRHRPAVNVLFRSAAVGYGSRVIGVVLSGTLDDGTAGLWWVKRHGGVALVQDPADTIFPDMIYSALEHVEIDGIVKAADMGEVVGRLVNGAVSETNGRASERNAAEGQWNSTET